MVNIKTIPPLNTFDLQSQNVIKQPESLTTFKFADKLKTLQEMSQTDPIIGAALQTIKAIVKATKWNVTINANAFDTKAGEDARKFVENVLFDDMLPEWDDFIDQSLSFLIYGFSAFEICYKKRHGNMGETPSISDDGKWGIAKFLFIDQHTIYNFAFNNLYEPVVILQYRNYSNLGVGSSGNLLPNRGTNTYGAYNKIPMAKSVVFKYSDHEASPYGRSLLLNAYDSWYYAKTLRILEAVIMDRDGVGTPVLRIPSDVLEKGSNADASPAEIKLLNTYKSLAENLSKKRMGAIVIPSDVQVDADNRLSSGSKRYDIELMSASGQRTIGIDDVIRRYERNIALAMTADFLFIGLQREGSFALAEAKKGVFFKSMSGWLDKICSVINRQVIPKLWVMNGMPKETMPNLTWSDLSPVSVEEFVSTLKALAEVGVLPAISKEIVAETLKKIGISLPEAGLDELVASAQNPFGDDDPEPPPTNEK